MDERRGRKMIRVLRLAGFAALGVVGLLAAILLLLLLAPVRNQILSRALPMVMRSLPGKMTVEDARWPGLNALQFTGVAWESDSVTVLSADTLAVSVRLFPLLTKDIKANYLVARGLYADIPGITALFAPADSAMAEVKKPDESDEKGGGFPRGGSVPGFPSVAIDSLALWAPAIVLSPESRIEGVEVSGGVNLSHGGAPALRIGRLKAHGGGRGWRIDHLEIALDVREGILEGSGSGALSEDLPLHLEIEPEGRDRFVIALSKQPGVLPPEQPGLRAKVHLEREEGRVVAASYDIEMLTPGTDELREIPALAERVKSLPESEGINLAAGGRVRFDPDIDVQVRLSLEEPEWLDQGIAVARYTRDTFYLDSLSVVMIDLDLFAGGYVSPDSLGGFAEVRAEGSRGLKVLAPESGIPDSMEAYLRAAVSGDRQAGRLEAMLAARGRAGGLDLDTLDLAADVALERGETSTVGLRASAMGLMVSTGAEIERGGDILVRLEPIMVSPSPPEGIPERVSYAKSGVIAYAPETGNLSIDNLQVQGSLGDLVFGGHLNGDGTGDYDLKCVWNEPPLPLLERMGDSLAVREAFHDAWVGDSPFWLDATGTMRPTGSGRTRRGEPTGSGGTQRVEPAGAQVSEPAGARAGERVREVSAAVGFRLPGPRTFAVMLPESSSVEDLGPLAGTLTLVLDQSDSLRDFSLALDLDQTEWLNNSVVNVTGSGASIGLDSLRLRAERFDLGLKGEYNLETRAGHGELALSDSGFAGRFHPAVPKIDLTASGTFGFGERPRVDAELQAAVRGDSYQAKALEASVVTDSTGLRASVRLPEGLQAGGISLAMLAIDYEPEIPDSGFFPAAVSVDARGEAFELMQRMRIALEDTLECRVDSMRLSLGGKSLEATRRFRVALERESGTLVFDQMDLAGTLGRVNFEGVAGPDTVNLEAAIRLSLPEAPPPALVIPEVLWPDSAWAEISATGPHSTRAGAGVSGFILDDGSEGELGVDLETAGDEIRAAVTITDTDGEILRGNVSLPGSVSVYPPSVGLTRGSMQAELSLERFPVAVKQSTGGEGKGPKLVARIAGQTVLAGPVAEPGAYGDLTVSFPAWPEMADFTITAEVLLRSGSQLDPSLSSRASDLTGRVGSSLGIGATESFVASAKMLRKDKSLLDAYLSYPLRVSLLPYEIGTGGEREMHAAIKSQALPLEEIDLLVPADIGLDGQCGLDLSAAGPASDPGLSGTITANRLDIVIASLAQVLLNGNVQLAGTARRPSIRGDFKVENGVVTMPEDRAELLPVRGEALLLDQAALGLAPPDSIHGVAMGSPGFKADYDVKIDIPSSFWLRGEALDIELRGALQITQKNGLPVIVGDLNGLRGTFLFLGRVFDLERADITFYGTEEINPSLDISLTSSIESNKVWVKLTGDLVEPRLSLESDPDMTEGDIMATILFGKPLNELNDGQGEMLRSRMTDVLLAMGAAKLQQEIAGQYGIDLVTIRSGREGDQENALVVGKYLTPKLLVMYEQGLKQQSTSYIVMEYLLRRGLRLEALYGNDGRSSAGVNIQKDW